MKNSLLFLSAIFMLISQMVISQNVPIFPTDLTVQGVPSPVRCNGGSTGSISITAGGGISPYQYLWNNGATVKNITGLTVGSYSLTVTDASTVTVSSSWDVTEPSVLTITNAAPRNVNCHGASNGAIFLTVSGGTSGYTYLYLWNDGVTTEDRPCCLLAACFTVSVTDANGCHTGGNWCLTEPPGATVDGYVVPELCNGGTSGSIDITVSGDVSPYYYAWSNGASTQTISGLTSGTYTVTVSDSDGCPDNFSWEVTQPTAITINGTATPVINYGENTGTVTITAGGGISPYQYLWSNGKTVTYISGLSAGLYTVTVTDANTCQASKNWTVAQPPSTTIEGTPFPLWCYGDHTGSIDISVGGGASPYTYHWNNGETVTDITGLSAGLYTITVTDATNTSVTGSWAVTEPPLLTITNAAPRNITCNGAHNGAILITVEGGTPGYSYIYEWNDGITTEDRPCCLIADCYIVTVTDSHGCNASNYWCLTEPPELSINCSALPVPCHGGSSGSIDLNVDGGLAPYTFQWSNGQTSQDLYGLSAGTYSVTVADAYQCSINSFCEVTEPGSLTINGTASPALCSGGSIGTISLTVGGGITPYHYLWNTGETGKNISGLSAGWYTVTVTDANTCQTNKDWQISISGPPTLIETTTPVLCHGGNTGSITITVIGGTSPFRYSWSNGETVNPITGLSAGLYSLTMTDAGTCQGNGTWEITQPPPLIVNAGADTSLCQQTFTVLTGNSSLGPIGVWSEVPGPNTVYFFPIPSMPTMTFVSPLLMKDSVPYIFKYTVTDGLCSNSDTVKVYNFRYPSVPSAGPDQTVCFNGPGHVHMNASAPAIGRGKWSYVGNPFLTQTIDSIYNPKTKITFDDPGTYYFLWTVKNGACDRDSLNHDTVIIRVIPRPQVYAGLDRATCNRSAITITDSWKSDSCMSLKWTSGRSGGTFSNDTILHPVFTPGAGDIAAGSVWLKLTGAIGCCSPCGPAIVFDSMLVVIPLPLTVTGLVTQHVSCNGGSNGSISITASGGLTGYNYLWSNDAVARNITGVQAGIYSVTVTDASTCVATGSWTITQPAALTVASAIVTPVACYTYSNGAIDMTIGGGTSPYAYLWSNSKTTASISGLITGAYTVTVTDAHSCPPLIHSWMVNQPAEWTIGITGAQTVCCNLSEPYTPAGYKAWQSGSYLAPLTYQWVVEGGTILSGQNTDSITVAWFCCNNGKVWLTTTDAKPCVLNTFIPIVIKQPPAPDITGPGQVSSGQENTTYWTDFYPGHLYTWTVIGGSVTSGQGTNSITVKWGPYPSCGCGSVSVGETFNGCTGVDSFPVSILPGTNIKISGYLSYDNIFATKLNGATVQLRNLSNEVMGTTQTINDTITGEAGYYAFTDIPNGTYTLSGSYGATWGGNNATDALLVQLHIIGNPLLTGLRKTVADVNASLTISGLDALYIKLRTIGSIDSYPAGDWKIKDTMVVSPNLSIPLHALCTGDVNGSFIPTGFKETSTVDNINDGIYLIPLNEPFDYSISSDQPADLGAVSLYMKFDPVKYEIEKIATSIEGLEYRINGGTMAIAWSDVKPIIANAGDPVFVFRMKAKVPIVDAEQIFTVGQGSEFADPAARKFENFRLKMSSVITKQSSGDITLSSFPNPFNETTEIVYSIPETGHVRLIVTDITGKALNTIVDATQGKGAHKIIFDPAEFSLKAGIYLFKLEVNGASANYRKVHRVIFTK